MKPIEKKMVAGHRGAKALYPENTLLSFRKAIEMGVDMLEIDLSRTKDGVVVILHDATVNRTTNGAGAVKDFTLLELKKLDAGQGETIPTLLEFCTFLLPYPEVLLNVEIKEKTHETVDSAMEILREYGLDKRSVFTCFDANIIAYLYDGYGVKTQGFLQNVMQNFTEGENGTYSKLYAVGIEMGLLTPELTAEFEQRGILPWCYCPDTDELVEKAIECNCRLVTANNPEPALRIFRERGLHS